MTKFGYIEIREYVTDIPIHRLDVTNKGTSSIEKIENGMNINLNHDKYYTCFVTTDKEQLTGNLEK